MKNLLMLFSVVLLITSCGKDEPTAKPAEFSIDAESKDFGEVEIPNQVSQEFTITNKGEQKLELKSFEFSGDSKDEFNTEAKATVIEGGKTYKFTVNYKPTSVGDKKASLVIVSNLGNHNVALTAKAKPVFLTIENPFDKENIGSGAFLSNNPMRLSRLAFDVDVEANATFTIKKLTINTMGKNPNATPDNPDNAPFIFKVIVYKNAGGLPGAKVKEYETKLEKTTELEGRLLGGQSQLFSRELSFPMPIELKAEKDATKYWLEVTCSRVTGIEIRQKTTVGLNLAASRTAFSSETPEWVISGGEQPQDLIYKLEGEVLKK